MAAACALDTRPGPYYDLHLYIGVHAPANHMLLRAVHATVGGLGRGHRMAGMPVRSADMARLGKPAGGSCASDRLRRKVEEIEDDSLERQRRVWDPSC